MNFLLVIFLYNILLYIQFFRISKQKQKIIIARIVVYLIKKIKLFKLYGIFYSFSILTWVLKKIVIIVMYETLVFLLSAKEKGGHNMVEISHNRKGIFRSYVQGTIDIICLLKILRSIYYWILSFCKF